MEEKKLKEIKKDAVAMTKKVEKVVIKNEKQMDDASELLTQIKARQKRIEEIRLTYTKPLNESLRKINSDFKEASAPYLEIEGKIKQAIIAYRQEIERKRREEEMRLQEEARKRAIEEAKKQKKSQKKALDEIILPTVEKQESVIQTKSGQVKTRKVKKFRIIDEERVPRKYWIIDERLIRQDVAYGVEEIKGVEIYEEEVLSVY